MSFCERDRLSTLDIFTCQTRTCSRDCALCLRGVENCREYSSMKQKICLRVQSICPDSAVYIELTSSLGGKTGETPALLKQIESCVGGIMIWSRSLSRIC